MGEETEDPFDSEPERIMAEILDELGVKYEIDFEVGKRPTEITPEKHRAFKADFRLPPSKNNIKFDIIIEVEGKYDHPDAKKSIPDISELSAQQRYNFWRDVRKTDMYDKEGYLHVRVPAKAVRQRHQTVRWRLRRLLDGKDVMRGEWLVHPTEPYDSEPPES